MKRPARARIKKRGSNSLMLFNSGDLVSAVSPHLNTLSENISFTSYEKLSSAPPIQKWALTIAMSLVFFVMSFIPLMGEELPTLPNDAGIMVFARKKTLMELGTSPFVLSSMVMNMILTTDELNDFNPNAIGLIVAIIQSCITASTIVQGIQLIVVAIALFNAMTAIKTLDTIGLSSTLILLSASRRIVGGSWIQIAIATVSIVGLHYMLEMYISVRLKPKQTRQTTTARLPLMYSSTTPLIILYTAQEAAQKATSYNLGPLIPFAVFPLTLYWPKIGGTTGRDLVEKWNADGLNMPGFRNNAIANKFVNRQVQRLSYINACTLVWFVIVTFFFDLSVPLGTLLLVVETTKSLMKQFEDTLPSFLQR